MRSHIGLTKWKPSFIALQYLTPFTVPRQLQKSHPLYFPEKKAESTKSFPGSWPHSSSLYPAGLSLNFLCVQRLPPILLLPFLVCILPMGGEKDFICLGLGTRCFCVIYTHTHTHTSDALFWTWNWSCSPSQLLFLWLDSAELKQLRAIWHAGHRSSAPVPKVIGF